MTLFIHTSGERVLVDRATAEGRRLDADPAWLADDESASSPGTRSSRSRRKARSEAQDVAGDEETAPSDEPPQTGDTGPSGAVEDVATE